jgi:hypothetical protein
MDVDVEMDGEVDVDVRLNIDTVFHLNQIVN